VGKTHTFLLKIVNYCLNKILKTDPIFLRTYQSFPGLMFTILFVALKVFLSVIFKRLIYRGSNLNLEIFKTTNLIDYKHFPSIVDKT